MMQILGILFILVGMVLIFAATATAILNILGWAGITKLFLGFCCIVFGGLFINQ